MTAAMTKPLSICALTTGGSSGRTFANIEAALRGTHPDLKMTIADTEQLNLRQQSPNIYPGNATVVSIRPEDVGLRTLSSSQSINLMLNGGMKAWRRMVATARTVLTDSGAQAVMMCTDRIYIETAFIEAARSLGIPTVLVQEGPMSIISYGKANSLKMKLKYLLAPIAEAVRAIPPMPDYGCAGHQRVLAVSDDYKRRWIDAGVPASTIRVVGVARFDSIGARSATAPARPNRRRVMFVVQPFAVQGRVDAGIARDVMRMMAQGLNLVNRIAPIDFVIRAHPRSRGDHVAAMIETLDFPHTAEAPKSPIEDEIPKYDCIIGHYSTALLEAVLLGVPVIIAPVPLDAFVDPAEGAKQGWMETIGLPVARDFEGFAAALESTLNGIAQQVNQERLQEETGVVDGQSTQRLANEILEITGHRAPNAPVTLSASAIASC